MPVGSFAVEVSRFPTFYEGVPFPTVALPALCQIGFLINARARAVSASGRCWRGCWFTRTALMRGSRRAGSYRQAALRMIKSICGGARVKVLRLSSHSLFLHDCIQRLISRSESRAVLRTCPSGLLASIRSGIQPWPPLRHCAMVSAGQTRPRGLSGLSARPPD
jgi:hypothetical protein